MGPRQDDRANLYEPSRSLGELCECGDMARLWAVRCDPQAHSILQMAARSIPRTTVVAVFVATVAALVARAWLQLRFVGEGVAPQTAADLSYLVVPVVLLVLLFPLWRVERSHLCSLFKPSALSLKVIISAILAGVLLRLLWWGQLVFGISFGLYRSSDSVAIADPVFSFQCPSPELVVLNLLVMSVLTPVIEEVTHRGYLLTAFRNRGMLQSVLISAIIFAVFHKTTTMPFALFAGVVFGVQYWHSESLWPSFISHCTVNTFILLDWRCLSGHWNPSYEDTPLWFPGVSSTVVMLVCLFGLYALLRRMATEA